MPLASSAALTGTVCSFQVFQMILQISQYGSAPDPLAFLLSALNSFLGLLMICGGKG